MKKNGIVSTMYAKKIREYSQVVSKIDNFVPKYADVDL